MKPKKKKKKKKNFMDDMHEELKKNGDIDIEIKIVKLIAGMKHETEFLITTAKD